MSEKISVESLDETYEQGFGILIYKVIADYILGDLALGGAIRQMRVLIDIRKPIFAVSVRIGPPAPPIVLKDYAGLEKSADGIHVVIHDETYATDLLKVLWDRFGKDKIKQIDRWETVIPPNLTTPDELQEVIVAEPGEKMMENLMDAITRVIPEGFRIGFLEHEENGVTIVASENPVQADWIQMVRTALARPPKPLPRERLEEVGRKPRFEEKPPEFEELWRSYKKFMD